MDDAITEALENDNLQLQNMSGQKYVQTNPMFLDAVAKWQKNLGECMESRKTALFLCNNTKASKDTWDSRNFGGEDFEDLGSVFNVRASSSSAPVSTTGAQDLS